MASFTPPAAYLRIEDQLDLVGQKVRGLRIARGAVVWGTVSAAATFAAVLAAHWIGTATGGASHWTWAVLGVWALVVAGTFVLGVVRPVLTRTPLVQVARLVESKVPGLNNGLTNGVLLARAGDLQQNPYLPQIFEEIHATMSARPVGEVVRMAEVNRTAVRAGMVVLPLAVVAVLFRPAFGHGWQQMMHPAAFVPQSTGAVQLLSVKPGDVTLVTGQPLEIEATARCLGTAPDAKLIFDGAMPSATLAPAVNDDGTVRYAYRLDRVDATTRYRLDVGGTESPWYTATVVHQIKLTDLTLSVAPPAYTHAPAGPVALKPDAIESTPVSVPQGSVVQVAVTIDVPANGAMLQIGDRPPVPMAMAAQGRTFAATVTVLDETPMSVLLTDGAGQVVATVPDRPLVIHCVNDAAPAIEVHWPTPDATVAPNAQMKVSATLHDDYGLSGSRVLMAFGPDAPLVPVDVKSYEPGTKTADVSVGLGLVPAFRKHGNSFRVQIETTDDRDLAAVFSASGVKGNDAGGPQTTTSATFEIKFRDPEIAAREEKEQADKLRAILTAMLKDQRSLNVAAVGSKAGDGRAMEKVRAGQEMLKGQMVKTAETFAFDESNRQVQKTLQVLALNPAAGAVEAATLLAKEKDAGRQAELSSQLQTHQRRIASVLESLLALLNLPPESIDHPTTRPGDQLAAKAEAFQKLDEALKQYMKEQQRILDQQASLAKKPVDNYTEADNKLAEELRQSEDKLDAFMKAAVSDFSKLAEQDMANSSVAKEAQAIYSETTMAKDALAQKATEIAVPAEENGLEGAKELSSNLERWLSNTPDRQQWTQEDLAQKSDTPLPELPKELQDMVGELMEQQEDLFDQVEDMNANITDSADKGIGWDAADGPIADMSAKGITGNQLPNNNEMGGRAGEGRSGKSQGEFVGDTAVGKGGRNTPTRLDPTPYAKGQVSDTSKDPVGGATGGGKMSGQGATGLQGPVPPAVAEGMKRLATKQAELRNQAERLNLQYHLDRYDNQRLRQATDLMRQVETDLNANRYQNAMRRRDVLVDDLDASRMLLSGEVNVRQDTSPTTGLKLQRDLNDAAKGELPPAWSDSLKEYYRKLSAQ